jgi:hypothetical protein
MYIVPTFGLSFANSFSIHQKAMLPIWISSNQNPQCAYNFIVTANIIALPTYIFSRTCLWSKFPTQKSGFAVKTAATEAAIKVAKCSTQIFKFDDLKRESAGDVRH